MLNYKLIGNLSFVDLPGGARLWPAYLLVDGKHEGGHAEFKVRQVRGFAWSGAPVFTFWLKPEDKLQLGSGESNMKMLTDDAPVDIGATGFLRIGEFNCALGKEDYQSELLVKDYSVEMCDHQTFLRDILQFYRAPYIGQLQHVPVEMLKRAFAVGT